MSILVLTAMEIEKRGLLDTMEDVHEHTLLNGSILYKGKLEGVPFSLIETGIGKVNAAMTTALAIKEHAIKPSLVINSGVAGGLAQVTRCDIIISENLCYYDVDVRAFDYALGQVPGMPKKYEADKHAIQKACQICDSHKIPYHVGQIVTGDEFINDNEKVIKIKQAFPLSIALEMEGAAVAQVAHRCEIPFLVIRAISDTSDDSAKESYEEFLAKAAQQSQTIVRGLIHAQAHT